MEEGGKNALQAQHLENYTHGGELLLCFKVLKISLIPIFRTDVFKNKKERSNSRLLLCLSQMVPIVRSALANNAAI